VRRVLIVENHLLLGAGIQDLLNGQTGLELIGVSPSHQEELVREIRRVRPDVVVIDEDSQLTDPTDLLASLKNHLTLRVVVLNTSDDVVRIYDSQEVSVTQTSQLINIIRA
jgi:DNA-binding NarL/FixJ family response regulator